MQILDGKITAENIRIELADAVEKRKNEGKKIPHLAAVLVGTDGGSLTYVNAKVKACDQIGFKSTLIHYEESVSQETLLNKVQELNNNDDVDGFIVQLPLPDHIDESLVKSSISSLKEGTDSILKYWKNGLKPSRLSSATPAGILELMKRNNVVTEGKNCVVVGRSTIVGSPLSILLGKIQILKLYCNSCTLSN